MLPTSKKMADRIRAVKNRAGLTQKVLSGRLGVSQKTIGNYLSGATQPDPVFLARLCEEFSISPAWILLGEGQMQVEIGQEYFSANVLQYLSPTRRNLLRDFFELVPRLQEIDRFDDLLREVGKLGSTGWIRLEGVGEIEEFEWKCLCDFIELERNISRLQPRHLHRRGDGEVSTELKKAMRKAEEQTTKLRQDFQAKIALLAKMWTAI